MICVCTKKYKKRILLRLSVYVFWMHTSCSVSVCKEQYSFFRLKFAHCLFIRYKSISLLFIKTTTRKRTQGDKLHVQDISLILTQGKKSFPSINFYALGLDFQCCCNLFDLDFYIVLKCQFFEQIFAFAEGDKDNIVLFSTHFR